MVVATASASPVQGRLLLFDPEGETRCQRAHRHARQLLRLLRRYSGPLAAATALAQAVSPLERGSSCGRQHLRSYRHQLAACFLQETARLGLFPRDQGRALALLEWQADRESERLRSHLILPMTSR